MCSPGGWRCGLVHARDRGEAYNAGNEQGVTNIRFQRNRVQCTICLMLQPCMQWNIDRCNATRGDRNQTLKRCDSDASLASSSH
ncbi:hypothetical protein J4Q44_G00041060 [Coregonus suidteri]|uniref:Uncharacterized protein n=1 Tax=Coregonus suidteri TaxID=861788 RepID=A0AAN8M7Z1_9TELE